MGTADKFDFASQTVIQILGLSSVILALTITFAKEQIAKERPKALLPLKVSWILEISSIVFGVWTLMALTGQVSSTKVAAPSVWSPQVTRPAQIQILCFLGAMISLVVAAWKSFKDA